MNYTHLSLDQSPEIAIPLRFFLTGPLFGIAAAILLLMAGPEILENRWSAETLALTHLLTLGFITMVMIGAMFQLLPVLAGSSIPAAAISSRVIHTLYTSGVVFLVLGLGMTSPVFIKLALFTLLPSLFAFLILASISLHRAKSSHASVSGMRISILSLWITLLLGGMLASGSAWDAVPLLRQLTSIHIAWAAIGWVSIMLVAISYQVIPMFLVTNDYPDRIKRFLTRLLFFSLLIWSLVFYFKKPLADNYVWLSLLIVFFISGLLIFYIIVTLRLQMQRKKRLADGSLYFWITGLLGLLVSVLVFVFAEISQYDLSILVGLLFFTGFVLSIINGMLYKIVPFLIWLHLHQRRSFTDKGVSGIPTMNEVISRKKMLHQYYMHAIALLFSVLAFFIPAVFFYPAAIAWLISWSFLFTHLVQALQIYKANLVTL